MRRPIALLLALLWSMLVALPAQDGAKEPPVLTVADSSMVFTHPPFRQCHASTLVLCPGGTVRVACFAGSYEGAPDVMIWSSVRSGKEWSEPEIMADGKYADSLSYPCWNPVLFRSTTDTLYLFYKVGKNPREWFGRMKTSLDCGITWNPPVDLPEGFLGPIKDKPLELPDGSLLCPSSVETTSAWTVHLERYTPASGQWTTTGPDPDPAWQVIQPTLLNPEPGVYRILCRSKENVLITSISTDSGLTWSPLAPVDLPNPNSGVDALTLSNGTFLLVYNPLHSGEQWTDGRNRLTIAWSADGLSWKDLMELENHPSGEFSYPAIIQAPDGSIHLTYTHNRTNIRYIHLNVNQR